MPKIIDPNVPWFTRPDKPSFKNLRALRHKLTSSHSIKEISERTKLDQAIISSYDQIGNVSSEEDAKILAKDFDCPYPLLMDGATKETAKELSLKFVQKAPVESHMPPEFVEELAAVPSKIGQPVSYKPIKSSTKEQKITVRNLTMNNVVLIAKRVSDEEIEILVKTDKKHTIEKGQKEIWLAGMITQYEYDSVLANRKLVWASETVTV